MILISLLVLYLSSFYKSLIRLHHDIGGKWHVYLKHLWKLTTYQKEFPKGRLELHQVFNDKPEDIGLVPFQEEIDYSNPKKDKGEDLFIYGASSKERTTIKVYFSRRPEKDVENGGIRDRVKVSFELEDGTGDVYWMEEESVVEFNQQEYRASGFAFEVLQANKIGRIKFRGYLRRNNDEKLHYVQIRFLCLFYSKTFDHLRKFNEKFLAKEMISNSSFDLDNLFEDKIEQFCQIKGTFKVEERDEIEIFFLGTVGRRFLPKSSKPKRVVKIFGFDQDGNGFQIGLVTVGDLSYRYGFITRIGLNFNLLEEISLTKEELKQIHSRNSFTFKAKFVNDKMDYNFEIFSSKNNWKDIKLNGIDGICYVEVKEFSEVEQTAIHSTYDDTILLKDEVVVSLNEDRAKLVELSGGKGASLAQLKQLSKKLNQSDDKFTVPCGVVVTSIAYELQTKNTKDFASKIKTLCQVAYSKERSNLEKNCCEFVEWFSEQKLENSIKKEIQAKIRLEFGDQFEERSFAVRSSGAMEDSSEMSAAGQMTTYLGVRGLNNLFEAVMKCWASQFAFVPVEYKRGYGQELDSPMAVVIQEMVDCDCAGVIFTCNPTNGDERLLTITSNFGLGESVVSASADPDTLELAVAIERNCYQHERKIEGIVKKTIGKKSIVTRLKGDGVENEKMESGSESASLSDELAIRLGQISLKIQQHYGNARDIEWGIKDGQLYMFQSRPITNLDSTFTSYELMHENDTPHMSEYDIYSRAHWGENSPGSLSWPANFFFGNHLIFLRQQVLQGLATEIEYNPYRPSMGLCCNQLMFNISHGMFTEMFAKYPATELSVAMVLSFFGHHLDDPDVLQLFQNFETKKPSLKHMVLFPFRLIGMVLFAHRRIPAVKYDFFVKNKSEIVHLLESVPFRNKFEFIVTKMLVNFPDNIHMPVSLGSSVKNMILRKLLQSSDDNSNLDNDFNLLLSQCNDVVSADVPNMMREIAKSIKDKDSFQNLSDQDALDALERGNDESSKLFSQFKKVHGHRGYREMDPFYQPWKNNPIPCVQVIKSMLKGNTSLVPKQPESIDNLLSQIKTQLSWWRRVLIKHIVLPWCKDGVGYRENTKSIMVKGLDSYRNAMWHLAEELQSRGILPEAELLFFLKFHEINRILSEERNPMLVMKAKQRKRLYPAMNKLKYGEFIKGFRMGPMNIKKEIINIDRDSMVLNGTAVTVGEIKARVCVAESIEEAINIQSGDILVTYSTDIGWSPYFPLISGLVTEIGGTISHGSVIAREFGIPCLIAVENACSLLKTGDIAYLDTKAGTIVKVKE